MTKTITQDNLIRFMYGETTPEESSLIEEALRSDWELKELYETLQEGKAELDKVKLSPRKEVVDKILRYSKDNAPMEEHSL
ncbi:MAG: hypothetical protein R2794_07345 [Chitinophagales bacterium]